MIKYKNKLRIFIKELIMKNYQRMNNLKFHFKILLNNISMIINWISCLNTYLMKNQQYNKNKKIKINLNMNFNLKIVHQKNLLKK